MSKHSFLYGILVSLTSSVNYITTHAPAPNGFLKRKLNYTFQFKDFDELRQKGKCIPDGLIINDSKQILIIPECKSALPEEEDIEPRLSHQVDTYACEEFYSILKGIIPFNEFEIVVLTFAQAMKQIVSCIQDAKVDANIVVWALQNEDLKEQILVKKVYGKHIDSELDKYMSLGVYCEPPPREFIDPDMPEPRIVFIFGCRLLNAYGECLLKGNMLIKPTEFRKGNLDLVFSESKLRHFFRVLNKLVPDLCEYQKGTGNLKLKKRLDPMKVSSRLSVISSLSIEEYRKALGLPIEKEQYEEVEKIITQALKPRKTPKLTELMWGEEKS